MLRIASNVWCTFKTQNNTAVAYANIVFNQQKTDVTLPQAQIHRQTRLNAEGFCVTCFTEAVPSLPMTSNKTPAVPKFTSCTVCHDGLCFIFLPTICQLLDHHAEGLILVLRQALTHMLQSVIQLFQA